MITKIISLSLLVTLLVPLNAMKNPVDTENLVMYMDMGKGFCGEIIDNAHVLKSNTPDVSWYNRVFAADNNLSQETVQSVQQYMDDTHFAWWVSTDQTNVIAALEQAGYSPHDSEPAMIANLKLEKIEELKNKMSSHEKFIARTSDFKLNKFSPHDDLTDWIKTSAQGFGIDQKDQSDFVTFITNHADASACSFYLADFGGVLASTSLMIEHKEQKFATLHLLSTIPDWRGFMLATEIILCAMADAADDGYEHMILLSSPMAHSLFQMLGFLDYKTYKLYSLNNQDNALSKELDGTPALNPTVATPLNNRGYCAII